MVVVILRFIFHMQLLPYLVVERNVTKKEGTKERKTKRKEKHSIKNGRVLVE
jgi:hypothetical protein